MTLYATMFTWHMYGPRSLVSTLRRVSVHVSCAGKYLAVNKNIWSTLSLCVMSSLALLVITWSWMARMTFVSDLIQATWGHALLEF